MHTVARKITLLKKVCNTEAMLLMKRQDGNGNIQTFVLNTIDEDSTLGWHVDLAIYLKLYLLPFCHWDALPG
jgi:hypothetical protein